MKIIDEIQVFITCNASFDHTEEFQKRWMKRHSNEKTDKTNT